MEDKKVHVDLIATKKYIYLPCEFVCSNLKPEEQNAEYGAYIFKLSGLSIRFRTAKITPTKIGQFVTLWERVGKRPIQPYDVSAPIDYFVISVRQNDHFGQFVFPKQILFEKDILSKDGKGGKRAIRVYPPWDNPVSLQAQKTQKWQLEYFLEIRANIPVDLNRARLLYR